MMLNAQKTISLFFKTADFERAFGRFLANHSRVIKALKRSSESFCRYARIVIDSP
jgi:hypothetical protein